MSEELIFDDLLEMLGEAGVLRLVEAYAGLRQFIPKDPENSDVTARLGIEITTLLAKAYGGNTIPVPLARTFRARIYRDSGMSNREIAARLGLTENGVQKIFIREKKAGRPLKSKRDHRQLDLFRW
jgi:hypothetical protein